MGTPITASMLYNLVACPHRVTMDLFADPAERDPVSPFVQLLWERGNIYERQVVSGADAHLLDLSGYHLQEKESKTREAMDRREPLIYSGRISWGDLIGEPDLLRLEPCGYVPGDIKSGSGEEGEEGEEDEGRPKTRYAVQLALYVDVLQQLGRLTERRAFVWDIHGREVPYDFAIPYGKRNPRTLWEDYEKCLTQARGIAATSAVTLPALSASCKLCQWRSNCLAHLKACDDLTLLPELGRAKRDAMRTRIATVGELAVADLRAFIDGKKTVFAGVGPASLDKFQARARLLADPEGRPYAKRQLILPVTEVEVFFDVETDPMLDLCYLHGFVVRQSGDNATERYVPHFAKGTSAADEEAVFRDAWAFLQETAPCALYFYSPYERTTYRALQAKYPGVCTAEEVEALFAADTTIDLYSQIVRTHTEWPTHDYSIKTLAKYLRFAWRDTDPSGASSIEWFKRWLEAGDPAIRQRILDYNEDDCRATRVLLDGLRGLPVRLP